MNSQNKTKQYSRTIFGIDGEPMVNPLYVGNITMPMPSRGILVEYLRTGDILGHDIFGTIVQQHGGNPHLN